MEPPRSKWLRHPRRSNGDRAPHYRCRRAHCAEGCPAWAVVSPSQNWLSLAMARSLVVIALAELIDPPRSTANEHLREVRELTEDSTNVECNAAR